MHELSAVTLQAPLPRPPSIRDGYAFRQHVETARRNRGLPMIPEFDQFPVFYFANHGAVVGPSRRRPCPRSASIGSTTSWRRRSSWAALLEIVSFETADDAIFGMTIMNELVGARSPDGGDEAESGASQGQRLRHFAGALARDSRRAPAASPNDRAWVGIRFGDARQRQRASPVAREHEGHDVDVRAAPRASELRSRSSPGRRRWKRDVRHRVLAGAQWIGSTRDLWLCPEDVVVLEIDGLGRLENRIVT